MLDIGDTAPEFEMTDQSGRIVRLSEFRGLRKVVLFFYPKDNTLVCNLEVCAFRDAHLDLLALGAVVLGVSSDTVVSHKAFAERWELPYQLLTDTDGRVSTAYHVARTLGLFPGRVTYVIDKDGIVQGAINDPLRAGTHVKEALALLRDQRNV